MRLSPILLAAFTVSATLGLSRPVAAQATDSVVALVDNTELSRPPIPSTTLPGATSSHIQPASQAPWSIQPNLEQSGNRMTGDRVIEDVTHPDSFPVEFLSQVPEPSAPAPVTPTDEVAPGTQAPPGGPPAGTQTPQQETPEQIEFDITPSPSQPRIEIEEPPQDIPTPPPTTPPTAPTPEPPQPTAEPEPRVLVAEVVVSGAEADLQDEVYGVIRTQPGRTTTRSQLQEDINAIFETGFFSNVRAIPEDTPLGVRVTFVVQPNPVLRNVQVQGSQVLPQDVVNEIFADQYGTILNLRDFQVGINELNEWYQTNGYVLAQVVGSPQVGEDGTVTLEVAEGVIEDIQVRFINAEGEATDEEGNPIEGRTREFIITREFESQSGDVFNRTQIERDLQRVFGLGIFEDVRVSLNPGQDPRQVDVIVNVAERNTGSVAAGVGVSSASGIFGTVSYQEQNLGGNNQRLNAEVQFGERELLFDVGFTDPWIAGDPFRTSYTVNAFSRRSISLIFDGGDREVTLFPDDNDIEDVLENDNFRDQDIETILRGDVDDLETLEARLRDQGIRQQRIDSILDSVVEEGDRPRVQRLGGGVSFGRPLGGGWRASAGVQYQNVSIRDGDGDLVPEDALGNDLSFSGSGRDDLFLIQLGAVRDRRNDPLAPTSGSLLRLSTDQTLPFGQGSILFNRVRGSYSYYIPVNFTDFTEGPETLAFNIQAGTVLGDLPPYEAFSLGGTDSVRGYDSGELGSGRSFLQATVEYRFPIIAIVGGALFVDVGTDLGTADDVPGSPAEVRDKPGSGFGVGVGVRVQSPVGQIRVDYAVNDDGDSRLHFGIGERF